MRSLVPLFSAVAAASAPALAIEPVSVPSFRAVELNGGGIVTVAPAPVQRVTLLEGSTQYTRIRVDREGKLEIDACNERCPRNYRLRMRIETPNVIALGVNGGGLITTASGFGSQREFGVAVHGGGKIDARSINAAAVGAAVDGGGLILVRSNGTLGAAVNGGGQILYAGNPHVTVAINGGGNVSRSN